MVSDSERLERSPRARKVAEKALLRLIVALQDHDLPLVVLGGLVPEVRFMATTAVDDDDDDYVPTSITFADRSTDLVPKPDPPGKGVGRLAPRPTRRPDGPHRAISPNVAGPHCSPRQARAHTR